MDGHIYLGKELEIFEGALHWKRYWTGQIRSFVNGKVAEIGAGIGANTPHLYKHSTSWLCIEPDPILAQRIVHRKESGELDSRCAVSTVALRQLPKEECFDTILYIDVLEHIQDDRAEVREAARRLLPGGCLVVLSPAHQWLFSPFDAAIGHFRRYTRSTLIDLNPPGLDLRKIQYLDSIGMLVSIGNRCLLRTAHPTATQISLWDRVMVPVSRFADWAMGYHVGKSIIAVWQAH
jgi:SAM-dependent methyltransferase